MLKFITLSFLLLGGQHQLLLLSKLQILCTGISKQLNVSLFLLLMIITSVGFTICCCSVIHFFYIAITSSQDHFSSNHNLLPHPNLAFTLTTPTHYITTTIIITCALPPPPCLHITLLHCYCFYNVNLIFTFRFYILHLLFTHGLFYPDKRPIRTKLNLCHFLFFPYGSVM